MIRLLNNLDSEASIKILFLKYFILFISVNVTRVIFAMFELSIKINGIAPCDGKKYT